MNQDMIMNLVVQVMELTLKLALPLLLVGLVIGLVVSVMQAVTQIQEQTLSFIPKVLGLVAVIALAGPWMLAEIITWTEQLYASIPTLVGGG